MAQKKTSRKRTTTAKAASQEAPETSKAPASTGDTPEAPKVKKVAAAKKVAANKTATKKVATAKAATRQAAVKPKTSAGKTPAEAPSKKAAKKAPARKAAAPVVEAAGTAPAQPTPARKAAARKFPVKTVTTIVAQVDVGWGNNLYIRGEGAGLSWDHGKLMDWTDGAWTWTTTQATGPIAFKFLKNDEIWSPGDNLTVEPGGTSLTSPEL